METIFDDIHVGEQKLSPSEIQGWMESIRGLQKTGVARLSSLSNETMLRLLNHGNWSTSFVTAAAAPNPKALADWCAFQGDVSANFIPLSSYGLVHSNLLLHVERGRQSLESLSSPDVVNHSNGKFKPYLIKLRWRDAAGSILFNGESNPPHSLFVSRNTVIDEMGISEPILQLQNDPSCAVTMFSPDEGLDAWQELRLRKAFKLLYDRTLERIELLTGRAIIDSFARLMTAFAGEQRLDISIVKRQWVNNEFFASSDAAAEYYRLISNELLEHFSAVIGPRLLASNLREVLIVLPGESRDVLHDNAILPEGYIL